MHVCRCVKTLDLIYDRAGSGDVLQLVGKKIEIYQCLVMKVCQLGCSHAVLSRGFRTFVISCDSELLPIEYKVIGSLDGCFARLGGSEMDAGGTERALLDDCMSLDLARLLKLGDQLPVGNARVKVVNDNVGDSGDTVEHFSFEFLATSSKRLRSPRVRDNSGST